MSVLLFGCTYDAAQQAQAGAITLSPHQLHEQIPLSGEWKVRLGCLSEDVNCDSTKIKVPSSLPTGTRNAVYELALNFSEVPPFAIGLRIKDIATSYTVILNGQELGGNGIPAKTLAEHEPEFRSQVLTLPNLKLKNTLEIDVANFLHNKAGIWKNIYIGDKEKLLQYLRRQSFIETLIIGILLAVFFYHLSVYISKRKELGSLFFSIACFFFAIRLAVTGERPIQNITTIDFILLEHLIYGSAFFAFPATIAYYYQIFPRKRNYYLANTTVFLFALLFLVVLFFPVEVFTQTVPIFLVSIAVCSLFILYDILTANIKTHEFYLLFIGLFLLGFGATADTLKEMQQLSLPNLSPVGFLCLVLTQTLLLSKRNSQTLKAVESLSKELADSAVAIHELNQHLEQKVHARTKELESAKVEAEQANSSKTTFLASMSHEIRTPLHIILGVTSLLKESILSNVQQKFVDTLQRSANSLNILINDILDISKIDAHKMQVDEIPFDLKPTVHEAFTMLTEHRLESETVQYIFQYDDDIPDRVIGDPNRLVQVIVNLVGNAVKFTKTGSVELHVSRKSNSNSQVQFCILDTGIGIEKSKIDSIFTPFQQEDTSTTRKFGGTGLGLSISNSLIALMGGTINVESTKGKGSKFEFTLDLPKATESGTTIAGQLAVWPLSKRLKVLLVEDNPDNQMLFTAYLTNTTVKITIADNGIEAVEQFMTDEYDMVFMDIQIPKIDGHDATLRIRQWERENNRAPTPVVALSANAMETDRQKSLDVGCNSHITKPLKKEKLWKTILFYSEDEPFTMDDTRN